MIRSAPLALLLSVALTACASAPPVSDATRPYLPSAEASIALPPPPVPGTPADVADMAAFFALRADPAKDADRFQAARDDAAAYDSTALLARFAPALGIADVSKYPATLRLLDRLGADLAQTVGPAKAAFGRMRPYRRFALPATCDPNFSLTAPDRSGLPSGQADSYPSGHAARGWSAALVLAALDSALAEAILQRGWDYGDNRVVCGVHTPADVQAGRLLATALVARLRQTEDFKRDLTAAAAEFATP